MRCENFYHILVSLLFAVARTSALESEAQIFQEVCQEIILKSQKIQHNSAFVRDADGNPAYVKSVSVLEQISTASCIRWETYAHFESLVVAKDGCQAKFNVCYTSGVPPPSVPITESVDCITVRLLSKMREPAAKTIARSDGRGDLIISMSLIESFSAVSCVEGLSYSFYAHKVEAKYGCKGDFRVCIDPLIILEADFPV